MAEKNLEQQPPQKMLHPLLSWLGLLSIILTFLVIAGMQLKWWIPRNSRRIS